MSSINSDNNNKRRRVIASLSDLGDWESPSPVINLGSSGPQDEATLLGSYSRCPFLAEYSGVDEDVWSLRGLAKLVGHKVVQVRQGTDTLQYKMGQGFKMSEQKLITYLSTLEAGGKASYKSYMAVQALSTTLPELVGLSWLYRLAEIGC